MKPAVLFYIFQGSMCGFLREVATDALERGDDYVFEHHSVIFLKFNFLNYESFFQKNFMFFI